MYKPLKSRAMLSQHTGHRGWGWGMGGGTGAGQHGKALGSRAPANGLPFPLSNSVVFSFET